MTDALALAYRDCARRTRREARNFYFAFLTLPRRQRHAIYALYAFCREADDIADGPWSPERKRAALAALRDRLAHAADPDRSTPEVRRDLALADAIASFGVRFEDLRDVVDGVAFDLSAKTIPDEDALHAYCYGVASAVGLATLPVLADGAPPTSAMREAAIALGQGMQRINILRDVDEDLGRGRVYLPRTSLEAHGITDDDLRGRRMTAGLRALLAEEASHADAYLAEGRGLLAQLPPSGRPCVWLLAELYGRLLQRLAARDFDVFAGRVSLPTVEKLGLAVRALRARR
jgi:phytoene synthase